MLNPGRAGGEHKFSLKSLLCFSWGADGGSHSVNLHEIINLSLPEIINLNLPEIINLNLPEIMNLNLSEITN